MPGRKRLPIEIHRTIGTFRPGRHAPVTGSDPDHGTPEYSASLSGAAKAAWAILVPLLARRRIVTLGDGPALEVLCETFAEWSEIKAEVMSEGRVYSCVTSSGAVMQRPNPKVAMLSDAARRLNVCFTQFGLTPDSRSKIPVLGESLKQNKFASLGGNKK